MANERLLYVPLSLAPQPDNEDRDHDIVSALWHPGPHWFSNVMLVVPSWQEKPTAANHPLVRSAIEALHHRGVHMVYWTRQLWVAWMNSVPEHIRPHARSHLDPAYYAAALAILRREAAELGVAGCWFDAEPYGPDDAPQRAALRAGLSEYDRMMMRVAIATAVNAVGKADGVYPAIWMTPDSYVWEVGLLGRDRFTSTTYYAGSPGELASQSREPAPPPGYSPDFTHWGIHAGKPGETHAGFELSTPAEVMALDMSESGLIRAAYPSVKGVAVYTPVDDLATMLREWPV